MHTLTETVISTENQITYQDMNREKNSSIEIMICEMI